MNEVELYRSTPAKQDELHALGYPVMRCAICFKPFKKNGAWLQEIVGSPAYCQEHSTLMPCEPVPGVR